MNKLVLIFIFTLATSGNFKVSAQNQTWDLAQCIAEGLTNSYDIKVKKLEVLSAQKAKNSRGSTLLPTVNLYGSQTYDFGSTIDPATNSRVSQNIQYDNFYARANVDLLDFGNLATAGKSVLEVKRTEADQKLTEYEYKLRIMESYYQAVFAQELLKIQERQLTNSDENLERIRKEVALGRKPKSDLYDMQLSHSQEVKNKMETRHQLQLYKTQLFQLLNKENIDIENITLEPETLAINHSAPTENPRITLAKLNYESSQYDVKIQRAAFLPSLSGFYYWSSFYYNPLNRPDVQVNDFNTQITDNRNHQFGVQLTIPVFNGFKSRKSVNEAQINSEIKKTMIASAELQVRQELELTEQKMAQLQALAIQLQSTYKYAQAAFRTTQAKFESDKVDATVYTTVKNQLLSAEYDLLKNRLEFQYAEQKAALIQGD